VTVHSTPWTRAAFERLQASSGLPLERVQECLVAHGSTDGPGLAQAQRHLGIFAGRRRLGKVRISLEDRRGHCDPIVDAPSKIACTLD
jgi:hypothetical protein